MVVRVHPGSLFAELFNYRAMFDSCSRNLKNLGWWGALYLQKQQICNMCAPFAEQVQTPSLRPYTNQLNFLRHELNSGSPFEL